MLASVVAVVALPEKVPVIVPNLAFIKVPENTSDYEAWILSSLSKVSKNIFEFGTCSGKTTFLMALNSSDDSKIMTLTLDSEQTKYLIKKKYDTKVPLRNIQNESIYKNFYSFIEFKFF